MKKLFVDIRDFCRSPYLCVKMRQEIRENFAKKDAIEEVSGELMSREDQEIWKKAFLYYAVSSPRFARKIAVWFCNCKVSFLKKKEFDDPKDPIFVCVVKDDLERIKMSYEHHRRIGVNNFVYIDNGSSDGTLEWLLEQDVCVCQTFDDFIMWSKVAWVSKIVNYYGFDRWYLILDSDELFAYPGLEQHPIQEYVEHLVNKGIERDLSFMLDMYSNQVLFEKKEEETIWQAFRFFDKDTYSLGKCLHYQKIKGGPRERLMKLEGGIDMLQNKYPLVYMQRGDVYRYHFVSPYQKNFGMQCTSVLMHYKFLNGDLEKYQKIAEDGNYAHGSQLYKEALSVWEKNENLSFYSEHSAEYKTSEDLLQCSIVSDWKR